MVELVVAILALVVEAAVVVMETMEEVPAGPMVITFVITATLEIMVPREVGVEEE